MNAPSFQWYPKDFLTDEHVRMMTFAQRGLYVDALCLCWLEGSLPADVSKLARLLHADEDEFRRLWPGVRRCFRRDHQRLIHPRLDRERAKQVEFRERQSAAGQASARTRAAEHGTAQPQTTSRTVSGRSRYDFGTTSVREGGQTRYDEPAESLNDPEDFRTGVQPAPEPAFNSASASSSASADLPPCSPPNGGTAPRRFRGSRDGNPRRQLGGAGGVQPGYLSDWKCPHKPHCGSRSGCYRLVRIAEMKTEQRA